MTLKSGTCDALSFHCPWALIWGKQAYLINVTEINGGEALDLIGYLVEYFILAHAVLGTISFLL